MQLKRNHTYFYQVQTQLYTCKKSYCDLYVNTKKDYHVERILPDTNFIKRCNEKCEFIFKYTILPELVAKYFSRDVAASTMNFYPTVTVMEKKMENYFYATIQYVNTNDFT